MAVAFALSLSVAASADVVTSWYALSVTRIRATAETLPRPRLAMAERQVRVALRRAIGVTSSPQPGPCARPFRQRPLRRRGVLEATVTVSAAGAVTSVDVSQNTIAPALATCLAEHLGRVVITPAPGAPTQIAIEIRAARAMRNHGGWRSAEETPPVDL